MSFTSGKISHDLYLNIWEGHSPYDQMRVDTDRFRKGAPRSFPGYHYRPRPEFDHHNPILIEARTITLTEGDTMESAYDKANNAAWQKAGCPEFGSDGFTEWCQYEDHAWRVLEKLAALA